MQAFCVEASDLDGDGDQDVLSASFADNRVAWYENDGNGVFSAARDITTKAEGVSIATAADLDGDGDLDVASASYRQDLGNPGVFTEKIAYYLNNGGAPFSGQQLVSTAADGAWSVHAADLDGDGDRDLLSASISDGEIAWYAFDGAGGFGPQQVIGAHVDGARDVFAADLDADSDLDVVACFNSSTGNVIRTYENLGGGLFAAPETVATGLPGPRSVHAADLDFDGDSDIAYTAANGHELGWLRNNGDGTWTRAVLSSGVSGAEGLHAATWTSTATSTSSPRPPARTASTGTATTAAAPSRASRWCRAAPRAPGAFTPPTSTATATTTSSPRRSTTTRSSGTRTSARAAPPGAPSA
jgi:hypothetical protein